ncbi:PREDICTED: ATP synthase subunit e, mitochondrial [Galeopterus variegatus]|uniref:ATP synthase subunit e, mitochondrial n=1 Tax=Galeopterus variegatus TaxID=482537 RepID=A0ABM0QH09_GALVR|nr:PREDICTED: ATP synthase subunit e, mitochondrial [Galeopterus variegatus]
MRPPPRSLRLCSLGFPSSLVSGLCFRCGGQGQDGAAGAGLSAHQGYLKPRAEEERRVAAEEKKRQDELKRIARELAEAQDDSILK